MGLEQHGGVGALQLCGPVSGQAKPRMDRHGFGSHRSLRCHLRLKVILPVEDPAANPSLWDTERPQSRTCLPGPLGCRERQRGPVTASALGAVHQREAHRESGGGPGPWGLRCPASCVRCSAEVVPPPSEPTLSPRSSPQLADNEFP